MAAQRSQVLSLMRTMLRASKSFKVRPAMPRARPLWSWLGASEHGRPGRLGEAS